MNPEQRRNLIKELLSLEPRLQAKQIASLAYPTQKVIQVNSKPYPSTYQSANNMLRRMAARKEIRVWSFPDYDKPDWFLLNSTPKKKAGHYFHEVAAADVFTAYAPYIFEHKGSWGYEPMVGKERADRGMEIRNTAYLEVDMCSENIEIIYQKIDQYIEYSRETGEQFHVIFEFVGEQKKAEDRVGKTLAYAAEKRRHHQFVATTHRHIEAQPFAPIFLSPEMEFLTIKQLLEDVI